MLGRYNVQLYFIEIFVKYSDYSNKKESKTFFFLMNKNNNYKIQFVG